MASFVCLRLRILYVAFLIFTAIGGGTSRGADLSVTSAKIQGGRLVITGTTASPRMRVRLDGQVAAPFNVISSSQRMFVFTLVYHPGDCVVTLQKLLLPSSLGPAVNALVADCGPRGLLPRGIWNATTTYAMDDLVVLDGSSWRAKVKNSNKRPPDTSYWEQFTAKGDQGDPGQPGPAGPQGPQGGSGGGVYASALEVSQVCDSADEWLLTTAGSQYICAVACLANYVMIDGVSRIVIPSLGYDGIMFTPSSDYGAYHSSLAGLSSQIVFVELDQVSEAKASMRGVCAPIPSFP
jgi:hypothetical protein